MRQKAESGKKELLYIRALLTLIILIFAAYNLAAIPEMGVYIYFYLFILVGSNIFLILLPEASFEGTRLQYVLFIFDIILLSLGAYWLAYLDFKFFIIMFLTIFISALSRSVKLSILIAFVVNVLYIYMKTGGYESGIASMIGDNSILNIPFLFIVAFYGSFLAEKANEETEEKKRLEKTAASLSRKVRDKDTEIASVISFSERVYDSFNQGVIIIDDYGMVRSFNRACEYIFVIKKSKAINRSYRELNFLGPLREMIARIKVDKKICVDEEIIITTGVVDKRLIINTGFIKDPEGNPMGVLCTVELLLDNIHRSV